MHFYGDEEEIDLEASDEREFLDHRYSLASAQTSRRAVHIKLG